MDKVTKLLPDNQGLSLIQIRKRKIKDPEYGLCTIPAPARLKHSEGKRRRRNIHVVFGTIMDAPLKMGAHEKGTSECRNKQLIMLL